MFIRINADRVINTKIYDAGFLVVPTEDDETPRGFKLCAIPEKPNSDDVGSYVIFRGTQEDCRAILKSLLEAIDMEKAVFDIPETKAQLDREKPNDLRLIELAAEVFGLSPIDPCQLKLKLDNAGINLSLDSIDAELSFICDTETILAGYQVYRESENSCYCLQRIGP